jgi:hypothetical protein
MRKADDDLKLNISEIFGDDWAKESEPTKNDVPPPPAEPEAPPPAPTEAPLPPVEPEALQEIPAASEIKFNDSSEKPPVAEPMVINMQTGSSGGYDLMDSTSSAAPEAVGETEDIAAGEPFEEQASSLIRRAGTSSKNPLPHDFFIAYDQFRQIFLDELKDLAGARKTNVMLVKTFEASREKYPAVFRNANWDTDGNLLEDGSLNPQRMLDNKSALDQKQAEIILDTALISLLNLRLLAVEKGLGTEYSVKIRTRMKKWLAEEIEKNGLGKDDPKILRRLSHYLL